MIFRLGSGQEKCNFPLRGIHDDYALQTGSPLGRQTCGMANWAGDNHNLAP